MFNSGYRNRRATDGRGVIGTQTQYLQTISPAISVSSWSISGSDDTALDPAGGQTVLVNGSGFAVGVSATVGGTQIGAVTIVSSTQLSFTSPANAGGSYSLVVYNVDGSAGILVPGLVYSAVPTWTTAAGTIGSFYETTAISTAVVATADSALTYSLSSGSLPVGSTLYANGVITGTAPVDSSSTTYTFAVTATDAELQDTTRTFTLTVNVDVVTWVTPGTSATITLDGSAYSQALSATDAAGYAVSYTANTLPTGLTLSAGTISGTPTVDGNISSLLTATAATTNRSATNTVTWVVALSDTYFQYVALGMSANQSIETQSFVADNSTNNAQLTVFGDTRAQKSNPYQAGYYSVFHPSTTNGWQTPANTATNIIGTATLNSTSTFTFEAWIYPLARHSGGGSVLGYVFGSMNITGGQLDWSIGPDSNGKLTVFWYNSGNFVCNSTNVIALNNWTHIAVVVNVGVISLFINGTKETLSGTTTATTTSGSVLGYLSSGGYTYAGTTWQGFNGYISNLRVVKGIPLYTATFTPSTSPLLPIAGTTLLTNQSNRFSDNSINNYTLTLTNSPTITPAAPFATVYQASTQYYSGSFNGSSDYLTLATSPTLGLGTGDFTIEYWCYPNSISGTPTLIDFRSSAGDTVISDYLSSGAPVIYINSTNAATSSQALSAGAWAHVAYTRSGTTLRIFVNGVQTASVTNSYNMGSSQPLRIANNIAGSAYFNGYISNLRVVKGLAVYTGNFVPATAPLAATQSSGTNTAAITQPSYSVLFNGSSQYLTLPTSSSLQLGSLDFTFEGWMYLIDTTDRTFVYWNGDTGGDAAVHVRTISGKWALWISKTGTSWEVQQSALGTATANTWYHVAVVRNSTNIRLYINGSDVTGGGYTVTGSLMTTYTLNQIGTYNNGFYFMNGYISNIRLTLNQALYTANFTPTTSPLTTTSQSATAANVALLTCQSTTIVDNSLNLFAITNTGTATVASPNPFATGTVSLLTVQSPTFVDSSYNSLAITAATTTVKPLAQSPFTPLYYSNYFNGASSISLANTSQAVLNVTTGATFTIEAWVNLSSLAATRTFIADNVPGNATAYWAGEITTGGYLKFWWYSGSQIACTATTTAMSAGTWYHVAVVANAGALSLYVNGTPQSLSGTTTLSAPGGNTASIAIGQYGSPAVYMLGYISNLRITNGLAVYTGAFTPATAPLAATQSAGTNTAAITQPSYSVYFNGSASYLSMTTSALAIGSSAFTVEFWIYKLDAWSTGNQYIIDNNVSGGLQIWIITSASSLRLGRYGVDIVLDYSYSTLTTNTWYHIAYSRSGSNLSLFVNGTRAATTASGSASFASGGTQNIGRATGGGSFLNGYISNFRVVNGTAVYDPTQTTITVPTSALTAISNTSLLTCQSTTIVDNSTNLYAITNTSASVASPNPFATGSVNLLTAQSPYFIDTSISSRAITQNSAPRIAGTAPFAQPGGYSATAVTTYGSGYFDGTGDYLVGPASNTNLYPGAGDFTIDFWNYLPANPTTGYYTVFGYGSATPNLLMFYTAATSKIEIFNNATVKLNPSWPAAGQWNHFALVRSGTTLSIYINGVFSQSTTEASNFVGTLYIGADFNGARNILGYISDFRIVKGTALYTSNFAPQFTASLSAVTNTQLLTLQTRGAHNNSDFVDQSGFNNVVTRSGNTTNGTFDPYGNNFSTYFNGSTYFSLSNGGTLYGAIAGSLITIEFWVMTTAIQAITAFNTGIFGQAPAAAQNGRYAVQLYGTSTTSTQTVNFYYTTGTGSASSCTTTGTIAQNTWNHIAVTIDATTAATSTVKIYINGTGQTFTNQNLSTHTADPGNTFQLGAANDSNQSLTGYLSNFRFTRGQLVYTGNFTPPTAPLTALQASGTNTAAITNGSYVKALMMQSNRFNDNSAYNYSPTVATGTPQVQKFSPFSTVTVPTYYSGYFDGTGDYLLLPVSTNLAFGTGDYTVECWVYLNSVTGTNGIYSTIDNSGDTWQGIQISFVNTTFQATSYISAADTITHQTAVTTGQWYHIAMCRSGTATKSYLNGVQSTGTTTSGYNLTQSGSTIGSAYPGTGPLNGYISNLRVLKGTALYTATFTPPTAPLTAITNTQLLTCQSNTFVDNSTNYFAITANGDAKPLAVSPFTPTASSPVSYTPTAFSGSMYFDGTGDYLTIPASANLSFGTGNFTIEAWAYPTSSGSYRRIFSQYTGAGATQVFLRQNNDNALMFYVISASSVIATITSSSLLVLNTWNHCAISRNGSSFTLYLNGVSVGTASSAGSLPDTSALTTYISTYDGTNEPWLGYLSDVRVTKGVALYTANFYPGASPATPTYTIGTTTYSSNLLLSGATGGVIDFSRTVDLETVADAKVTPFSPYNTTYYSNLFDGGTSYFTGTTAVAFPIGTETFTVEMWLNKSNAWNTGNQVLLISSTASSFQLWVDASVPAIKVSFNGGATPLSYSTSGLALGTWYHLAVVRSGSSFTMYVNGVSVATGTNSGSFATPSSIIIGNFTSGTTSGWNGYVSNLRIVRGTAVYTGNFTPSTTPLTAVSGTSLLTCQSNKFVDNSTNALTLTPSGTPKVATQNPFALNSGISYYFDGTGDYLTMPENTALWYLGTGDFTIEAWVNPAARVANNAYIIGRSQYGVGSDWAWWITNSGTLQFYMLTGGGGNIVTSTGTVPLNAWTFVTVVRSSAGVKLYINGVNDGTLANYAGTLTASYGPTVVGNSSNNGGSTYFNGYITDLRFTRGYARYTGAFTPPTAPYKTN